MNHAINELINCFIYYQLQNANGNKMFVVSPAKDDHLVRVTVINLLASLKLDSPSHVSLAENMIERLMQKHRVIARENAARHFVNSLPHRQKHRIVQMVLMLEPFINEVSFHDVLPKCTYKIIKVLDFVK